MLAPLLLAAALAPTAYTVSMPEPAAHFFHVEVRYRDVAGPIRFAFPAYVPGGWQIDEVASNVLDLAATDGAGRALASSKVDKQTWTIAKPADATVVVRYRIYADEKGTPYAARLNGDMAHANLSTILGYVPERQTAPATLAIRPAPGWKVACSLPEAAGTFAAPGYDLLADGIFIAGNWWETTFEDGGARYRVVFSKKPEWKDNKVEDDLRKIVRESAAVFGETPFTTYMFLYILEPDAGRGGIEHRDGTSMCQPESCFYDREAYLKFLGLTAHEFVHAWNVKRMRPAGLGPFDLTQESYTHNLYVAEGFTTYYGGIVQVRSGAITREEYYKNLAEALVTDRDNVGIREKALQDLSWDWWLTSDIPYLSFRTNYSRGSLVALVLDLEIRRATAGKKNLDDVMRGLYARTGKRATGYTDVELREALVKDGAPGMDARLNAMVAQPGPLDLAGAIARAGLEVVPDPKAPAVPLAGWRSATKGNDFPLIDWVEPGSPAARAGLQSRDLLIALDDRRVSGDTLSKELERQKEGAKVPVAFIRDGTLRRAEITLGAPVPPKVIVRPRADATPEQKALLEAWLAPRAPGAKP